jgi:hypothetical protein
MDITNDGDWSAHMHDIRLFEEHLLGFLANLA